ncbi:TM2 domain-containing protein [Acinetobacter sp. GD03873]|nr:MULTISPECIES: TM2 domain-containing protein [unclassified Acinetobacter]MDH0030935.1 TM2 domain-containing protein [Acinetobacter sp. GD04021]MDH0886507.1 TM2 domain-containing protein [Acinetobacter sp. GD03873]MDH2203234.1 TM2 domain-containing protein [Acinetobacter sp. GD03647]MDH2215452.1 TM2 domain-containing protein [Acinetobacter sp. GD03641]
MTIENEILIEQKISNSKKSKGVAYLLLFILGGIGAHRFYLEAIPSALVLLAVTICSFVFTPLLIITGIWFFVDLFLIPSITDKYNNKLLLDARMDILRLRNEK